MTTTKTCCSQIIRQKSTDVLGKGPKNNEEKFENMTTYFAVHLEWGITESKQITLC